MPNKVNIDVSILTNWRDHKEEIEEIYSQIYSSSIDISKELVLSFKEEKDKVFMQKLKGLKFPIIEKISFNWVSEDEHRKILKEVLKSVKEVDQIEIGADEQNSKFEWMRDVIKEGVEKTKNMLAVVWFSLNAEDVKFMFETAKNVEYLMIRSWKVELNSKFSLDPNIKYCIKTLDLKHTARQSSNLYINSTKMNEILKAISQTNLKDNLKHVKTADWQFKTDDLKTILSLLGFKW